MAEKKLFLVIGAKTAEFEAKMREVSNTLKNTEKAFQGVRNIGKRMSSIGQSLTIGLTLPIMGLGAAAVKASVDLESAFAGVRKTVNGTEAELNALKQGFDDMSKRIPIATTELYRIGEAAGQLGIKKENILAFSEVMAKLGVSTNMASDEAATALARFANITQMPQENFDRLGATIVALGNNLATTESEITEMGLRLAGAGTQVGMTEAQILSFAGALSSVGIDAEAGGSAFSRVFLNIQSAVMTGGDAVSLFAQVAGMSIDEFSRKFNEDAAGAVVQFIEGLKKVSDSGQNVSGILEAMGLGEIRVRDALLRASNAGDLFTNSLELGTKAWEDNVALNKEAEQRFKTSASQFQLLKNRVVLLGGAFGGILTPAILSFLKPVGKMIDHMTEWSDKTKKVFSAVALLVAALGLFLLILGKTLQIWPYVLAGVKGLSTAFLFLATNPIGWVILGITALITAGVLLYKNWDKVRYYGLQAWGALKNYILSAVKSLIDAIAKIPGIESTPIGNKIKSAQQGLTGLIASNKATIDTRSISFAASQEEKAAEAEAKKVSAASKYTVPDLSDAIVPTIDYADKSKKAADEVKTAWIGTSDQVSNALKILQTQHEIAAEKAEMQGDKLASLRLQESQLNEELAKQKEVVVAVQREIEANTKAGVMEGETKEDLAKRTDELNAKLADELKNQADLEKQIYDTQQAIKDQAEQLKALSQEIAEAAKKYDEDMVQALEDYQQKVAEVNAKLAEDEQKLTDEYEDQLDQRAESLSSFVDLFDAVTSEDVSGKQLLENLRGQVKTFEEWTANIQKLVARGVDQGLIEQLREMGPKAAPQIAALTTLTDAELAEYVALWRQKNEDARNEATTQLEEQRSEMEEKLIEIRETAAAQLAQYKAEWEETSKKIRENALTEIQTIQTKYDELVGKGKAFGINFMDEFGAGIIEGFQTVQQIIQQQLLETEALFPAHSPAEKGPLSNLRRWGQNFVQTFREGIRLEMPSLNNTLGSLISRMNSPTLSTAALNTSYSGGASGPVSITLQFNGTDPERNWQYFKRQMALSGIKIPLK